MYSLENPSSAKNRESGKTRIGNWCWLLIRLTTNVASVEVGLNGVVTNFGGRVKNHMVNLDSRWLR